MIPGRWCAAAALAIALAASGTVAGQDTDSRLPATYLTALASYRAGDLAAAFGKLQELGESEVTEITRRLMRPDVAACIELAAAADGGHPAPHRGVPHSLGGWTPGRPVMSTF